MSEENAMSVLADRCELCRESVRERHSSFDRRLLALEILSLIHI